MNINITVDNRFLMEFRLIYSSPSLSFINLPDWGNLRPAAKDS
jgi:hypothetical protein